MLMKLVMICSRSLDNRECREGNNDMVECHHKSEADAARVSGRGDDNKPIMTINGAFAKAMSPWAPGELVACGWAMV